MASLLADVKFVDVDVERALKEEKKRKHKEKKKLRKEKKKQKGEEKHRRLPSEERSSGSEGSGSEYDEGTLEPAEQASARDDWLTSTSGRNVLTGALEGKAKGPEEAEDKDTKPRVSAKELNPYLASGADGKPANEPPPTSRGPPPAGVGDGGASWRLKALKRAQTLAAEEGRNVNEVVSERFGSLAQLTEGLTTQRAAHAKAHLHASKDRVRQRDGGEAAGYLEDVGSARSQMRRPDPSSSLSWRKAGQPPSRRDSGSAAGPSGRDWDHSRGLEQEPGKGVEGGRKDRRASDPDRGHGTNNGQPQDPNKGGRDRRPDGRGRLPRAPRDPLGRTEDAAVLRAAAAGMNAFASDGSFLDQFKTKKQGDADEHLASGAENHQEDIPSDIEEAASAPNVRESAPQEAPQPDNEEDDKQQQAGRQSTSAPEATGDGGGNKSAAAALRARLLGASSAGAKRAGNATEQPGAKRRQVEVLPAVDAQGRAARGAFGRETAGKGLPDGGRKPKRVQRYGEAGEKERYFRDDDGKDLAALVREQRYEGAHDIDANLAENIARKSRFREKDLDVDEEYDVDGGLDMYEARASKGTKEKAAAKERAAQIADARRSSTALDRCNLCFNSARRAKHLTIAIGQSAYLALPDRGRLAPLHCCIVPFEHVSSCRRTDEHVWTEMRNFKKCVIQMYMAQGLEAIFLETAMKLDDLRSHAVVHCVPVPPKVAAKAPIFFKKAIDDAESEWSQHHAKRLIDTRQKGLRGSIPPNFPYFFVEFGLSAGYVHVIDDEAEFDRDFGRSILAGLLKLPADALHRGARGEPLPAQQKLAADFLEAFAPYDWTAQL